MINVESIQNLHVLLSHRDFYGAARSIDDILYRPISTDLLCLLSILAFENSEEKRFRSWAASCLPVSACQQANGAEVMRTRSVFGRIQIFECWKQLLTRASVLESGKQNRIELAATLHELFARINDRKEEGDPHQHLVKAGIHFARDDCLFKLYRAQKIFLDGQHLAPYVAAFEQQHGFELESYLGVIFTIVMRCQAKRRVERFNPLDLDGWCIDLNEVHRELKLDLELLRTMMNAIAFTLDEGIAFARGTVDDPASFELFRNRPFLKLSETRFLPIEGKLVEELLFDNLLHRLHFASGRDVRFYTHLGYDFERYTQSLIEDFCASDTRIAYECIPEFAYGKSNAKSPDAMVHCAQNQTLIAFEVKSARYLDSILTSGNAPEAVADSFEKLRDKPWKQMHDAIERIVDERRHAKLTEALRYLFVAITMNEIPHSLQDFGIKISGLDRSCCFFSFGIHTFELLLIAASLSSEYTIYDMLRNAFNERHRISNRTTFIRFLRAENGASPLYAKIRSDAIRRLQVSLDRHLSEFGGSTEDPLSGRSRA
ncbi:hypothetical protein [Variovorax sp. 770b2]|uniref:hypothetical protein n=1 Tax=Variovorax sp. 770b2 TaxID=1566271 RepID=UPI0008E3B0F4|nr:hypothetical protein [Variovorax sp. 770b2]SFQ40903.1 hypothetical protein SAMN03159339_0366 [Variovorax sp. 770b2]